MSEGWAERVVQVVEGAGIVVIVVGLVLATAVFLLRIAKKHPFPDSFEEYRRGVGRGILLGLEFLVAADIIHTVVLELTFRSMGILSLIVLIRTFLSFTLEVEMNGRWPWQGAKDG